MRKKYQIETDEVLLAAICRREADAFAVLYDRYGPRMYRYFYRMFWRDSAKAEDFTQDLFLKIIEKATLFNPAYSVKTWLYTIAANMCKGEFRRMQHAGNYVENIPDTAFYLLPETIDNQLFETCLRASIDDLEEHHKQCFILRYQEALSVREISNIVGCPEGTVKSRLHHAVRKVAGQMEAWREIKGA